MKRSTVKRALGTLALLLVAGCSSSMQVNPKLAPEKDTVTTPRVLFIGDELVTAWLIKNTNPMWTSAGSPMGMQEGSASVLARLPALLAQHCRQNDQANIQAKAAGAGSCFDVVVVLAGTFDLDTYPLGLLCENTTPGACPLDNLEQMIKLAHQAGSKVLLCELPYTETQSNFYTETLNTNEDELNEGITIEPAEYDYDGLVTLNAVSEDTPDWSTDGLTPNSIGAQAFTVAAQAEINQLHVGELK
jgi:hypothetical protein